MLTGLEEPLLRIGKAVARQLALRWFAGKQADSRRGQDLSALVRTRFPLRRNERAVYDALGGIEDAVAGALAPDLARAEHGLAEPERIAALAAVSDALEDADLGDPALFAVDVDPARLAAAIRRQVPPGRAGLSARAEALSETALLRACVVLLHLVRGLPEFGPAIAVEQLRRAAETRADLRELLARVPVPDVDAPAGRDLDAEFAARYAETVARLHDRLDVIGVTTHHYEPRTTLTVAYLSLSVTGAEPPPEEPGHPFDPARRPTENLRVEAALGDDRRTVIRGEAGAGKSTLLRWLAVNAARSAFTGALTGWNGCVPFLVRLREFADGPLPGVDELPRVPGPPAPAGWAHRQFAAGRALLLVDGVDELAVRRRGDVRGWLRELLAAYPAVRVIVTSRPTAVAAKWLAAEDFRSVELDPMTPADVQVFLARWHAALLDSVPEQALPCPPAEVAEHERSLLAQLQARPHLRALARNPLLCAMVCALNLDRRAKLPRDRLALYSAALDMLLERRDTDRNVAADDPGLSTNQKLVLLRALAWWLNQNNLSQLDEDQAAARFAERVRGMPGVTADPARLLRHLVERSGVIRQPVLGKIDFIHRTFQEFLAAKEAVDQDNIGLLIGHARSDLWRETVLMACAHATESQLGRLLTGILDAADASAGRPARQLRLLAAACKETALLAPPGVLGRLDATIRGLLPPRSTREARSLATVGESLLADLPSTLAGLSPAQAAATVRTVALINGPEALTRLAHYAADPRSRVQLEVADGWQYFDPESYATRVLARAPLDSIVFTIRNRKLVPHLARLPRLRDCRVDLTTAAEISPEITELSGLTQLRTLRLWSRMIPANLAELARLRRLTYLSLDFEALPDDLGFLAAFTALRHLSLYGITPTTDLTALTGMPALNSVYLEGGRMSADTLARFPVLPGITDGSLRIDDSAAVSEIPRAFPALRSLLLHRSGLLELAPLTALPLHELYLVSSSALDLRPLTSMPELEWVSIERNVVPIDLAPLAGARLNLLLHPGAVVSNVDALGPGVRLQDNRKRRRRR